MVRWRQRGTIPFSPTIGIPAYLNGYAVIPLVAGLIEKGIVPGTAMAFMVTGGVTSIPAAMGVHALVRRDVSFSDLIFGLGAEFFRRLRIPPLGRVFYANLTSCPEYATMCAEVINTYLIMLIQEKLLRAFPLYVSRHFLTEKPTPSSLAFHQILLKNLFSHCLFDRLLAGSSYYSPFNISTACLLILPLQ